MKKFAFFAMLLGSMFLVGCGETKKEPAKTPEKPAATTDDKKPGDAAATTDDKKPEAATTPEEKK